MSVSEQQIVNNGFHDAALPNSVQGENVADRRIEQRLWLRPSVLPVLGYFNSWMHCLQSQGCEACKCTKLRISFHVCFDSSGTTRLPISGFYFALFPKRGSATSIFTILANGSQEATAAPQMLACHLAIALPHHRQTSGPSTMRCTSYCFSFFVMMAAGLVAGLTWPRRDNKEPNLGDCAARRVC